MQIDPRVEAWASLQLVPAASPRALVALLKAFGGPTEVLEASRASLARFVTDEIAAAIEHGPDPEALERTLAWLSEPGHALFAWDNEAYPQALLSIADPPPVLYFCGRAELLNRPGLAIVGSRNATPQGVASAAAIAGAWSSGGLTIGSGLALGVDAAAHRGGLTGAGSSIAVLGTGIDCIYPAANRALAQRLAEVGGLVSEFSIATPPQRANFPRRNRVISGLSRGVLVVEATLTSGSLITARFAVEQGRDVFAIPGSIHSPFSKGSHRLIKEGAKLVETASDVLEELRMPSIGAVAPAPVSAAKGTAERVLSALAHDPAGVDVLSRRCGLAVNAVCVALMELELEGRVAHLPGGVYQRLR